MGNQNIQRIILKKPELQPQEIPQSISAIILILVTQQTYKIYIDTSLTPTQLKQEIYSKISKNLRPQQMSLELNGKYLNPDDKLSSKLTNMDLLIQKKIPLRQISSIQYYSKIEDEITLEKGVVAVPCGHRYGRQALYLLLKYTIDEKQWQIKCTTCFKQIQFAFCSKILTLTKEQNEYFAKQLTKNWLQSNSKQCPGCKRSVKNEHNKYNKVKCADDKCKFGYFCFKCLKKWNSNDFKQCGNLQCLLENEMSIEQNSKQITLYDHLQNLTISVKIPKMRFCPKCKIPIEHSIGCKHVTCTKCKVSFCWVCLSIFKRSWNCGAYNEYCGQIVYKTS